MKNMEAPFLYGRIAMQDNYTNRTKEITLLKNNFFNLINTIIISPRRWGKASLVNKVAETLIKEHSKEIIVCNLDIFNCRTEEQFYKAYSNAILQTALSGLIDQLSLLFTNIIDALTTKQINFLSAIVQGTTNFSSQEVLKKYDLGSSANIKNLKKATLEKDLIDILPNNQIVLQDPTFEYWLKNYYMVSSTNQIQQ
ncbi:hypothetical protein FACS189463_0970 [Bacteroidia bacterium]|nr:hypothetical protein FACS189463_0970 [Bacteroidia bacterium]